MNTWHTIRRIKTKRFTVALQWEYEQDQDLSWCDSEILEKLERGIYTNCCFRVIVRCDGLEIAADYLGNAIYADPSDFAREHLTGHSYFSDMVRTAVGQARQAIHNLPHVRVQS